MVRWMVAVAAWACVQGCASMQTPESDVRVLARALDDRAEFRVGLIKSCPQIVAMDQAIEAAISIGAPIYNAGSPLGCYRIYEGAAFKILYQLGDACPDAAAVLRAGLARAESDSAVGQKAWTLRRTFDALQGRPTRSGSGGARPPR